MTISTENQKLKQLVQTIAPQSTLLRTWPLKGGISADMTALEIGLPDGQTKKKIVRQPGDATLKRNPHAAADEFKLLQVTQSAGLATQTPYYLDQSGTIFSTPYLVVEYIEGKPEFASDHIADFTYQLATHLAKIHGVDCAKLDLSFLPKQEGFVEKFGRDPTTSIHLSTKGVFEIRWNQSGLYHGGTRPYCFMEIIGQAISYGTMADLWQ